MTYLLHLAVESSLTYCYLVDEFVESPFYKSPKEDALAEDSQTGSNRIVRLAGWVKRASIVTNLEEMQLDFELAGQKSSIPVRFSGVIPKNFTAGKEVFVEGQLDNNKVFKATRILTRCGSKYKVKLPEQLSDSKNKPSIIKE